jgi:hypothetical protein
MGKYGQESSATRYSIIDEKTNSTLTKRTSRNLLQLNLQFPPGLNLSRFCRATTPSRQALHRTGPPERRDSRSTGLKHAVISPLVTCNQRLIPNLLLQNHCSARRCDGAKFVDWGERTTQGSPSRASANTCYTVHPGGLTCSPVRAQCWSLLAIDKHDVDGRRAGFQRRRPPTPLPNIHTHPGSIR